MAVFAVPHQRCGPVGVQGHAHRGCPRRGSSVLTLDRSRIEALDDPERRWSSAHSSAGDFSTYRLSIGRTATDQAPPAGFDARCASCRSRSRSNAQRSSTAGRSTSARPRRRPSPRSTTSRRTTPASAACSSTAWRCVMPDWKERQPADLRHHARRPARVRRRPLSYHQDAVATEAYLGTARRRVSVRRHARLIDYPVHDGATRVPGSPSAWIGRAGRTAQPSRAERGFSVATATRVPPCAPADLDAALPRNRSCSRPSTPSRHGSDAIAIQFHTWGDLQCCLPAGATQGDPPRNTGGSFACEPATCCCSRRCAGDDRQAVDADPTHRHAVRLDRQPVPRHGRRWTAVDLLEI